ncbi:MAG: ATP-binding protein [Pseudomonadota bacterium]
MKQRLYGLGGWWLTWLLLGCAGAAWIAQARIAQLQDDFYADARIAHRLLSQQVVQYDAVLATLALLGTAGDTARPERRLSALYGSILDVYRREHGSQWPDPAWDAAEAQSRTTGHPAVAALDLPHGRYRLVMGAEPVSHALDIDLAAAMVWRDWPMDRATSPARVALEYGGQRFVIQPGALPGHGWRFALRKALATESQPFEVVAERRIGWNELPWPWMLLWAAATGAVLAGARALGLQRTARRRAEELLRLGQVARLNTLGELAAGMAHELNQPLTALLANTQAAGRLLDDDPPDLDTARTAMGRAAEQARRAAAVVARLRRAIERPGDAGARQPVLLQDAVRNALYLLEPECARRAVRVDFAADAVPPVRVLADPVALEQVLHNLLLNALQALDTVPAAERSITIVPGTEGRMGTLAVRDSGPGISPELLPRLFEPFFSTRDGGLGLGLSLSETLAAHMGGSLAAANALPRGASFTLALPLAGGSTD